jgi:hypothetical protein
MWAIPLRLLFNSQTRWLSTLLLIAAVGAAALVGLWSRLNEELLSGQDYQITAEDIVLTPPPRWIRSDVRAEAIRMGSLDQGMSLMDEELTERVARAFALHPWIQRVQRVVKRHPARIEVEVAYRRPVCMVALHNELRPVDPSGVVLPVVDFSPIEARRFPRLSGIDTAPLGPEGTLWGDPRVHQAAEIASALFNDWDQLGLSEIVPSAQPAGREASYDFELLTPGGSRVLWGHSKSHAGPSEISPHDKVVRLKRFIAEHGSLDNPQHRQEIDIRHWREIRVTPRTARREDTSGQSE